MLDRPMWMAASTDVEQRAGNGQAQVVAGEGKKANSGNAAPASARFLLNWVIAACGPASRSPSRIRASAERSGWGRRLARRS
jgi:hypothetical protein